MLSRTNTVMLRTSCKVTANILYGGLYSLADGPRNVLSASARFSSARRGRRRSSDQHSARISRNYIKSVWLFTSESYWWSFRIHHRPLSTRFAALGLDINQRGAPAPRDERQWCRTQAAPQRLNKGLGFRGGFCAAGNCLLHGFAVGPPQYVNVGWGGSTASSRTSGAAQKASCATPSTRRPVLNSVK